MTTDYLTWLFLFFLKPFFPTWAYQSDLISEVGHETKQATSAQPKGKIDSGACIMGYL